MSQLQRYFPWLRAGARAAARHPSPYRNNNINAIRGDMNATHKRGTSDERVMNAHFKREEGDERAMNAYLKHKENNT
jgi:hypothetical protein